MKSNRIFHLFGSDCPTSVSRRLGSLLAAAAIFSVAAHSLVAQQAGSITTQAIPFPISATFIDAVGNVYTAGTSHGSGVTAGAAQTQPGGGTCGMVYGPGVQTPCWDAYIAKADASGKQVFGTLLGGAAADTASVLAVDGAGNVFVAGTTGGLFPTTANAAIASSTTSKTFAAKLRADGSRFIYATYLPDNADSPAAVAVDSQGNAYVAGWTKTGHAFITELSADGSTILHNVVLAGSGQDGVTTLVVGADGNLLAAGFTTSPDFPVTAGVVQRQLFGTQNLLSRTGDKQNR